MVVARRFRSRDLNDLGDHIHLSKPRLLFLQSLPRLSLLFPLAYASGESGERTGGELEGAQVCLELK